MSIDWGDLATGIIDGVYNSPNEQRQDEIINERNQDLDKMFEMNAKMQQYLIYGGLAFAGVILLQNFTGSSG